MAKKENNKAENPQTKTGAPVPAEQELPQDNIGEGTVAEQPQAETKPGPDTVADDADKSAAAEPAVKTPTKKTEPKVSDAVQKVGKALLKNNPDMSVVYMTADGSGFYEKNDAENHAQTLNNKAVTPVKKVAECRASNSNAPTAISPKRRRDWITSADSSPT